MDESAALEEPQPRITGRRLGAVRQFDYLSTSMTLAGTYRAVMSVFAANRETFGIALPTAEVWDRLRRSGIDHEVTGLDHLETILETLDSKGNLRRSQDTALARTIAELTAKRSLWRITEEGWRAEQAAKAVEEAFAEKGALRSNTLADLSRLLDDLLAFARKDPLDREDWALLEVVFGDIFNRSMHLASNASTFIGTLDEFLMSPDFTTDAFILVRDEIVGYVSDFLTDLRTVAPNLARVIEEVETLGVERLYAAAAASNPPPTFDGSDPVEKETARIRDQWAGVVSWFRGSAGQPATARFLADRASGAINTLIQVLGRINDARHHRISRSRDFIALARWFSDAPDDAAAHRIWHAVFGLSPARHLRIPVDDPDLVRGTPSWWDVDPVRIPPRLRELGEVDNRGRPGQIEDTSAGIEHLRAMVETAEARRVEALDHFLDRGPMPMSSLGNLEDSEFDLLLDCLSAALSTRPDRDGHLAVSLDGRYLISLSVPDDKAPLAVVSCSRGTMRSADCTIDLTSAALAPAVDRIVAAAAG
jgi:TIGR02677 family protein